MTDQLLPGGTTGQAPAPEAEPELVPGQEGDGKAKAVAAAQPKYATEEQLAQSEERIARRIQRAVGKSENRMGQRIAVAQAAVDQTVAIMTAQGIKVTPEQLQALKVEAGRQAMLPPKPAAPGQPGAETDGAGESDTDEDGEEAQDPITTLGLRMLEDAGVKLEPSDPEAKMVETTGTPQRYLLTLGAAISAKKARLSAKTPEQIEAEKQAALGRAGGALGTGTPAAGVVSTDSMLHYGEAFKTLPPKKS